MIDETEQDIPQHMPPEETPAQPVQPTQPSEPQESKQGDSVGSHPA